MDKPQHRHSISLIIPCYNDADAVLALLSQAKNLNLREIIVVDGGSFDGSQKRVRAVPNVTLLASKKGRGRQIATGVSHASGDIVWVLHADSQFPNAAIDEIDRIMSIPRTVLGCFPLTLESKNLALRLFAWLSKFDSVLTTFGDQGYFCRRQDYLSFGNGANYPLLEDVAFRRFILKTTKCRVIKSTSKLKTSARRFHKNGPIQTQFFNARILWRYFCGASPVELYNEYYAEPLPQILSDPSPRSPYPVLGKNKS